MTETVIFAYMLKKREEDQRKIFYISIDKCLQKVENVVSL